MDLLKSLFIAASGMQSQGERMRVVAENLANASSVALGPDGTPYRRKTVTFANELDRTLGVELVKVARIGRDSSPFTLKYEPGHPAANAAGYVAYPNVNALVEMMDLREAQRSYQANLRVLETTRALASRTLDLLRG
ncbi:MAG TPA: flagellar basal body rod protein FlgC [Alphaproteobacteria bacterium]